MDLSKRKFLQQLGAVTAGASLIPIAEAGLNFSPTRREGNPEKRYGMLIDLRRCIGCQSCTVSCSVENQTPQGQFRTTVNQYQVSLKGQEGVANVLLPRLCNHCDNPPCVPVCPVQATFQREDGIVVIDNERCVGCAYCVQACPYDARFINHTTQTADKCTFCAHRLEVGLLPTCVESCVGGARIIGDLRDPNSTIRKMLEEHKAEIKVLKPESGTLPQVFYLGLDDAFVEPLAGKGQPALWQEVF
ncbi:TPA: tetrathionate reductase subunit TtrB [Providencia stuartii]|uniref:tetrathionate reductase subunit TtrB n=1 Tax=Providencia stuartii TaxID=588 RepID=UPI0005384C32|nr:tetrathionate reductase subunit TtrB [Providencia stuartii]AXO20535.1 tetrathionate reductase subunit TtrB [Providencia stuartii]MBN5590166.1 tetrathionate reductase subunit TtrB [Providencia stuartii]HEM6904773.1 tetrathionate reductase subunit TtrB [Providencia stuartii]HEM7151846.1 tetrathionate reductase subunit TtrB [Providencia stuartii]HEM7520239.1 tetrathionate reductase subunit TtrB [Providencia stuartii]